MEIAETVIAIYDNAASAEAAIRDLREADIPEDAIKHHANTIGTEAVSSQPEKSFWSSLFGETSGRDPDGYDRLQSGSAAVSVRVPAAQAARVIAIFDRHHPVDLDDRSS